MPILKSVYELVESDLLELIENRVPEDKDIEYKREFAGWEPKNKVEFLADIVSFANANGGYYFVGIDAQNGIPISVNGLSVPNPDGEILRIDSIIRDGVKPRLPGLELRFIPVQDSKFVFAIRIPKSWLMPHMVIAEKTNKFISRCNGVSDLVIAERSNTFHSRSTSGKYLLDVDELRTMFTLSSTVTEKIRNFRAERIAQVLAGDGTLKFTYGPTIILHLVPLQSFSSQSRINLAKAVTFQKHLFPIGAGGFSASVNLDGILRRTSNWDAYVQLYHNGVIETVNSSILRENGDLKLLPGEKLKHCVLSAISDYLATFQQLNISPPIVAMLSITNVKDYGFYPTNPMFSIPKIDRDVLLIPEIILDKLNVSAIDLKPMFDSVWNAAGYIESDIK